MQKDKIFIHSFVVQSENIIYTYTGQEETGKIIINGLKVDFKYKNIDATITIKTDKMLDYEEIKDKIIEVLE